MELRENGWSIVTTTNTSTPVTSPDAHGISYGGPELSILCEREYEAPKVLAGNVHVDKNGWKIYDLPRSRPCNPPRPGGR